MKKYLFLIAVVCATITQANAYTFWLHTDGNDTGDLLQLEQTYDFHSGVVGYIFDDFGNNEVRLLTNAVKTLGAERTYHVSVSPFGYSAEQVAHGAYDMEYRKFFQVVKDSKAKFLFRTMHEMNGSWYSWSGDPESFRKAWIHIHALSREMGLTSEHILFIFSVNSEDLPSADGSIGGELVYCSPDVRAKKGCLTFEDYYPGDAYVDMLGISLYNWGRARSETWATWKSFPDLLENPKIRMFSRLKSYGKPLFLDEVGTTAVNFPGEWSNEKVQSEYQNNRENKNMWLDTMRLSLTGYPEIVGALYFNQDKTHGLTDRTLPGELDWAILSTKRNASYTSILPFFSGPHLSSTALPFLGNVVAPKAQKLADRIFAIVETKVAGDPLKKKALLGSVVAKLEKLLLGKISVTNKVLITRIVTLAKEEMTKPIGEVAKK